MAVIDQVLTDKYAIYNGDSCEVLPTLPSDSIGFSVYSPPFAELYQYSNSPRDLSNCASYEAFLEHYAFIVRETHRVLKPGRLVAVHCMDLRKDSKSIRDFPGDIIRLHEECGFYFHSRLMIKKDALKVAMRTRSLHLRHSQIVKDSAKCGIAGGDYIVVMVKEGENAEPITHDEGFTRYAGTDTPPPALVAKYAVGWDDPATNKLSHWIWQRYATCVWDDINSGRILPYCREELTPEEEAKGISKEKHVCPLQLDVIERCLALWSNPGDVVLTPFLGVGSEAYVAVQMGRKAVGIELKPSYFRQAVKNVQQAEETPLGDGEQDMFEGVEMGDIE